MDQAGGRAAEQLLRAALEALDRRGDHLAAAYVSMALGIVARLPTIQPAT